MKYDMDHAKGRSMVRDAKACDEIQCGGVEWTRILRRNEKGNGIDLHAVAQRKE
jgi:hypothetical protein